MCGIVGVVARSPVNQLLYDGMTVLQHRGQDAAGIVTAEGHSFHMHKGRGLGARRLPHARHAQPRRATWASRIAAIPPRARRPRKAEAQPFYVNSPYGIVLGHNGNLINSDELRRDLFMEDRRHVNTGSDSEILLNVPRARDLRRERGRERPRTPTCIFTAVAGRAPAREGRLRRGRRWWPGTACSPFRDPHGIRPLIIGRA
jgi:amidophosphoribosyltransferase